MKQILHFTATWCKPCERLKPIIEEYIKDNSDIEYIKIDVDEDFEKAEEFVVMSVPTIIVLTNKTLTARHTGIASYDEIHALVNKTGSF